MKHTVVISAIVAASFAPDYILATPVGNVIPRSPRPVTVKVQRRAKPKEEDVKLKAWIDRGQDVQYYGQIKVGTPAQKLTVNFDTGSEDLLLPGINCASCSTAQWPHNLFNPNRSSTFQNDPGFETGGCFGTGGTTIPFAPGNYPCATVNLVTDKVCIDDLCAPSQVFGLGTQFDPALVEQPFDGILGMPIEQQQGNGSFYWYLVQSGQLPGPEFGVYIEPRKVNGDEITLGGVDEAKFRGDINYLPLSPISTDPRVQGWVLDLPAVYVDGKRLVNSTEPGKGQPIPFGEVKLDLGGAFIAVPNNETAVDIYSQISPLIYAIDPLLGIWGAPCNVIDSLAKDLTFTFGADGGKQVNMTVPKENFNAGPLPPPYDSSLCQAIYVPLTGRDPVNRNPAWTFGVPLFKNYYTVWNGRALTFGIARPNWKKASAP